jgi:hypothetical protein
MWYTCWPPALRGEQVTADVREALLLRVGGVPGEGAGEGAGEGEGEGAGAGAGAGAGDTGGGDGGSARCQQQRFRFVWYENPKMTVPDVYHVQVFWCKTS